MFMKFAGCAVDSLLSKVSCLSLLSGARAKLSWPVLSSIRWVKGRKEEEKLKLNMDTESSSHPSIKGDLIGPQNSC